MLGFEKEVRWLEELLVEWPPFVTEDDLGTTFASVGIVLSVAAALETESPALVELLTGFPADFVRLVFRSIRVQRLREGAPFRDLVHTILTSREDFPEVRAALEVALEAFWFGAEDADTDWRFTEARAGRLFGGSRQDWVDAEELEAFLLAPPKSRRRAERKRG
jgi:hypothetical protein